MASDWKAPDDWQKDGSIISGVTDLKTGAWTSMLSAKEVKNGREVDVVIKTFSVPAHILEDADRVAREREKFLTSARLQKQLTDAGATGWVPIMRVSEDPTNTSFSMQKLGASLQDLLDRHVNLTAKDLYEVTLAVLQGFDDIMRLHKRSHGGLKASDVLATPSLPGPPYRMSDPSSKGETHSANDLYALGLILFQLIEHKPWDPLTPIIPTSNWARFKGRRDRWIQFLNMLLSPTGCQESLANVRKEAQRLKPASPMRTLAIAGTTLGCLGCAGVGVVVLMLPTIRSKLEAWRAGGGGAGGGSAPVGGGPVTPAIDPQVKAAWAKAHEGYLAVRDKWVNRDRDRYDHTKSTDAVRAASTLVTDIQLTDTAAYQKSMTAYMAATDKFSEALNMYALETKDGQAQDADALADFQKAQDTFTQAKADWDAAAAKFDTKRDHTRSSAFAQATPTPPTTAPADAGGRHAAADQLRAAADRYTQALGMAKQEDIASQSVEQAKTDYQTARGKFQTARDKWNSSSMGVAFDISAAKAVADKALAAAPQEVELTDAASYQKATDAFNAAAGQLDQANAALDQVKRDHNAQEADSGTALAKAVQAMEQKDYVTALAWYRRAADLGNGGAMYQVGLLYETGRGTDKSPDEAAKWYQRAADLNQTSAMVHLGLLYERGQGVDKDTAKALSLYKKAADLKDPDGIRNTAYLYANGIGVAKNPAEALAWYRKGADLKDASSTFLIGAAYEMGKGVTVDYTQAAAWYEKAANMQLPQAMNSLGVLYETGRGVKQDPAQALVWYKKAADLNFAPAICNVGALYDNGIGVARDHTEAFKWFHRGADLGHGMSMYNLAVLYETGRGTTADLNQALDWYRKAAHSDDAQASKQAIDRLSALGFKP